VTTPFPAKVIIEDFAAVFAIAVQKWFLGGFLPGKNPLKFLFLKPNPPVDAILAHVSLIVYYFYDSLFTLPSKPRYLNVVEPKNTKEAPHGYAEIEEKRRPHGHAASSYFKIQGHLPLSIFIKNINTISI